jgi:hypothetical protein
MNTKALETGSEASHGVLNPPLCGIVQLTNSDALHFRNWSFNNNFDIIIMAGKYPMGIMRIYTAMVERVKIFRDCPSLELYRSRLLQSRAQEDNSVSISWLGSRGVGIGRQNRHLDRSLCQPLWVSQNSYWLTPATQ